LILIKLAGELSIIISEVWAAIAAPTISTHFSTQAPQQKSFYGASAAHGFPA
jgi:hypothetical protein